MPPMPHRRRPRAARPARFMAVVLTALVGCGAAPARDDAGPAKADVASVEAAKAEREAVVDAMRAELERSMAKLRFRDYEPPYFIAYRLEERISESVTGKYGSIVTDNDSRGRTAHVEVRVGDYSFDNFANVENESFRLDEYIADRQVPLDAATAGIRGTLWLLSDEAYKKAISDYLTKKGGAVYATDDKTAVPSFSKEQPVRHRGEAKPLRFDRDAWTAVVEEVTADILDNPEIMDSSMEVSGDRTVRYLVNSEGTEIVDEHTIYSIQVTAWARADDGMLLENGRSFYARDAGRLPDEATIAREVDQMVTDLIALKNAPTIDPYTGPAILAPEASGVLFHETVGHRLEGERQRDEEEGRTFKGRVGKQVIPPFLSVYDDPTLSDHEDVQLNGFYLYDDEGVAATRAELVDDGVLRGFLKSRTPIEDSLHSNGHGRAQGDRDPIARMANLVIEAAPEKSVPYAELKARLLEEVRRQNKPFGLIIKDITGGSTNTSGYGYQAFKGSPRMLYKVDPATGEETLVRGVELVGTPLTSINKIVAASEETGVFNGYCGAESGYVPVSTIAPALLTTEIELQRTQKNNERPPILPPPWTKK